MIKHYFFQTVVLATMITTAQADIGWYSEKQANIAGIIEYMTPDDKTVLVTSVSLTENYTEHNFDDMMRVGNVTAFIRRIRETWLSLEMKRLWKREMLQSIVRENNRHIFDQIRKCEHL